MRRINGLIGGTRTPDGTAANASGVHRLSQHHEWSARNLWPISTVGLQLWIDASDSTTLYDATSGGSLVASLGAVARIEDKSGLARHFTQATLANRPTRQTGVQNGKGVIRFDGSNDLMSITSSTSMLNFLHDGDSTIFIVYRPGVIANPNATYWLMGNGASGGSPGGGQTGIYFYWGDESAEGQEELTFFAVANNAARRLGCQTGTDSIPANTFSLQTIVSTPQQSTIADRVRVYRNAGSALTLDTSSTNGATALPTGNATQNFTIGASSGTAAYYLNGDIGEILLYDYAMDDAARIAVRTSLMTKWGLA